MTREKAIEKAMILDVQGGYAVELVTKIYDEFESRTCENCKYLIGKDKESECIKGYLPSNLYEDEFGCKRFKRK